MRVVVQNGCDHVLSRKDVETVIPKLPARLSRAVNTVGLCQGDENGIALSFHKKEMSLELFSPRNVELISKYEALTLLIVGLLCVDDRGEWPERMSGSKMAAYMAEAKRLLNDQ